MSTSTNRSSKDPEADDAEHRNQTRKGVPVHSACAEVLI